MYIPKLSIQNFRIISHAVLDWTATPLIFVRGKKFAGKSSIGQSLSMILASTTDGLDAQGRGFESKIKFGEPKSVLKAEIQGKHLIERSVTLNTNTTGRTSNSLCLDDPDWHPLPFDNFLAKYKDAFAVALNTDYFLGLGEKEQKSLFAKLVMPEHYDFPKDKVEAVERAIGPGVVDFNGEPFAAIELAYKKLYKEREAVNRQVKEFVIPEPMMMPSGVDSESIKQKLSETKEKRSAVLAEKDEAVKKANEVEVKRASLEATLNGLRSKMAQDEAKLEPLKPSILSFDQVKQLTSIASKEEALSQLQNTHAGYLGTIQIANTQIRKLKDLEEKGATCPTCEQALDSAKISALIEALKQETVDADAKLQELDKQIESIGDVKGAVASLQKHDAAVKQKEQIDKEIKDTITTGKEKRAELDALPAPVNAAAPYDQPLADIDAELTRLLNQLSPVIAAEERKNDIAAKITQLEKLKSKAETVDELTKYFGKDGIKAKLIADYIGSFENSIQQVMGICGYKCALTLEPFDFRVETSRGYNGPVKELSGAEKHLFSATLQCAVSIAAGIKVVVIDEIQELGDELLALFYPKVYNMIQDDLLEQAVLIGYSLDKTIPKSQAPGTAYYYVEDGVVSLLGKKMV